MHVCVYVRACGVYVYVYIYIYIMCMYIMKVDSRAKLSRIRCQKKKTWQWKPNE
jgi:hypothetical protein